MNAIAGFAAFGLFDGIDLLINLKNSVCDLTESSTRPLRNGRSVVPRAGTTHNQETVIRNVVPPGPVRAKKLDAHTCGSVTGDTKPNHAGLKCRHRGR
jgi:hypothetical protein